MKKRKRILAASSDTDIKQEERKISPRARRRLTSAEASSESSEEETSTTKSVKNYEAMNTSEDGTNSDETPRLNIDLNEDSLQPPHEPTVIERTVSLETPRTVIEGPTSNLLNMLAKLEAAEAKQMELRTKEASKTAPITYCDTSDEDDGCESTASFRLSKSGHHSIEYEMEYRRSGHSDDSLDNRTLSETNLENLVDSNQDLNDEYSRRVWGKSSPVSNGGSRKPLLHSTPIDRGEMDVCDGGREHFDDEVVLGGGGDLVSLDSLEITCSSGSSTTSTSHHIPQHNTFRGNFSFTVLDI